MMKHTPIERCIAAVRQGNTILRGGHVADAAEEELRTIRSQIDKLQAELRATPPRAEVDVDAVIRHVLDSIEPFKPSSAQSCAIIDALRTALAAQDSKEAK